MMVEIHSAVIAIAVAIVCALVIGMLDLNWSRKYWKREAELEERARKRWTTKWEQLQRKVNDLANDK